MRERHSTFFSYFNINLKELKGKVIAMYRHQFNQIYIVRIKAGHNL